MVEDVKVKTEAEDEDGGLSYEEKCKFVNEISTPLATKKLGKKAYKLIKKSAKQKALKSGLKDVQSAIRKGEKGLVVFAGDVTPLDVYIHMPQVCIDKNIPYVYTPSRMDLGAAMGVKRGCVMVLVKEHSDYKDTYDELVEQIEALPRP
eukprot:TRINITY_DN11893_c0_g1_i3.p1 TRINITY_DN11893_c0_g1~~TRINITY_DN11893_c0_g1_i3.p1  ORF type:complete len:149 (-),score=30.96 TRINITY_DN11893_c0_g1_i3:140-586(-)